MESSTQEITVNSRVTNGGYHALRGFTYQFDHSLLTVCANPMTSISIEHLEDESYDNYCVQIKNRESSGYAPSSIRKPIRQLFDLSLAYPDKKFVLHCHFKDKVPETKVLTLTDLNQILGDTAKEIDEADRSRFVTVFKLCFAEHYEAQFASVIASIMKTFDIKTEEQAVQVHAVLQAGLIRIAQKKAPEDRKVTLVILQELVKTNASVIFEASYRLFLGYDKYRQLLHRKYFTFNKSSIPKFERLFVIDCDSIVCVTDLIEFVKCVADKYHLPNKSPAPYVCLRNCHMLANVKQGLWDAGIFFNDGTNFDGDRFRPDQLLLPATPHNGVRVKLIGEEQISSVITKLSLHDLYDFFIEAECSIATGADRVTRIAIETTTQVKQIIN
jgi:hypothetical protein